MTRGVTLGSGLLVTLATPATWPLALATFLLRGGIVLFVLPIVVLPTPVGIGNTFGPTLTALALGSVPAEAILFGGLAVAFGLLWLIGGGWLAAALEAGVIGIVASDDDVAATVRATAVRRRVGGSEGWIAGRILAARLVANLPLLAVLSWGVVRLVVVAYDELTRPHDVSTPLVLRVAQGAPDVIVAVVLSWMAGEIVGAIAARRIVLAGNGVAGALAAAVATCLRHPVSVMARFWIPTLALAVVVAPCAIASGSAWSVAGTALDGAGDPLRDAVSVIALVFLWALGLLLAAVICAWRAAIWTIAEVVRQGTFGGSTDRRPGDWREEGSSATL